MTYNNNHSLWLYEHKCPSSSLWLSESDQCEGEQQLQIILDYPYRDSSRFLSCVAYTHHILGKYIKKSLLFWLLHFEFMARDYPLKYYFVLRLQLWALLALILARVGLEISSGQMFICVCVCVFREAFIGSMFAICVCRFVVHRN